MVEEGRVRVVVLAVQLGYGKSKSISDFGFALTASLKRRRQGSAMMQCESHSSLRKMKNVVRNLSMCQGEVNDAGEVCNHGSRVVGGRNAGLARHGIFYSVTCAGG